ncbi:hypothetical protein DVH24_013248, partial [Malus domestica]
DWILESQQGFKQSNVADQCTHRGYAWSVSEKYILACDSVTLLVKPKYYDFFTRSLQQVHHYWPIRHENKCRSIKFVMDWGDNHKQKEELKMDYVYDYMFHLLNEYDKLLRFEPRIPKGAAHLCSGLVHQQQTLAPCLLPMNPKLLQSYRGGILIQLHKCNNGKINLIVGFNYSVWVY